jgi:hypothetical protein
VQTVGGHPAVPAPRRVSRPPFVAFEAPSVWSTLALTIHADGRSDFELLGASTFPRHWVYGADGHLAAKAGLTDFKDWWRHSFGVHTPWGDEDSPAFVTTVETALERELVGHIMRGDAKPDVRKLKAGTLLTEQGGEGDEVFLVLNGVLEVEVDGERLAEIGPGAILGERSALEGGRRTSTLRAITKAKVAAVRADQMDRTALSSTRSSTPVKIAKRSPTSLRMSVIRRVLPELSFIATIVSMAASRANISGVTSFPYEIGLL